MAPNGHVVACLTFDLQAMVLSVGCWLSGMSEMCSWSVVILILGVSGLLPVVSRIWRNSHAGRHWSRLRTRTSWACRGPIICPRLLMQRVP